jgi:Flp pilus assembly protein TadG
MGGRSARVPGASNGPRRATLSRDRSGNVALWFGLAAPVVGAIFSFVVDLASVATTKSRVQLAADAAALAVAQQSVISTGGAAQSLDLSSIALGIVQAHVEDDEVRRNAKVSARAFDAGRAVEVDVTAPVAPYTGLFRGGGTPVVQARAVARVTSIYPLCVLALNSQTQAIQMSGDANVESGGCIVQSNSKSNTGISANGGGTLRAGEIRSAGGYKGTSASFVPLPIPDYPAIANPLESRPPPVRPSGAARGYSVNAGQHTIGPGVYDFISVQGTAAVSMLPGVYYIAGAQGLSVGGQATLTGQYVGIYFERSAITIDPGATVELSAPKTGDMAGLLIWRGPGPGPQKFKFNSGQARKLLGTIYLPEGDFWADVRGRIAEQSAYTVIVARNLMLEKNATLVINANYDATDVPAPQGLGDTVKRVRLAE